MYGANLIYGVRLRVNVGERQAKKNLKVHRYIVLEKQNKKKKNKKKNDGKIKKKKKKKKP